MGAETILLASSILGAGGMSAAGSSSAARSQSDAANNAAQLGLQGQREGIQFQKDVYNKDSSNQYNAGQYLFKNLPKFDFSTIDPNQYFGEGNVNAAFDKSKQGLNQSYQQDLGDARMMAGESAAARGLLNPSLMVRSATNQVQQNYLPQFTGLEANRAGALTQNNKDLFQALFQNKNFVNMLRQQQYGNQSQLAGNFGDPTKPPSYF